MSQVGLLIAHPVHIDAGTIINIVGSVSRHPCSFDVNLLASDDDSDVALNFSANFADKVVITKSKRNGTWSRDEPAGRFPFVSDESFAVTVVTTSDSYAIKVNGELLYSFTHKVPLDNIKRISISEEAPGDDSSIRIMHVSVQDSSGIPTIIRSKMSTPYDRQVRLSAGDVIRVCGSVSRDPSSFSIGLLASDRQVAFHSTVRFDDKEIVMNAKKRGVWGEEERSSTFPLTGGEAFVAVIRVGDEGYDIVINGQHVHLFKHRIPVDQVQRFITESPSQSLFLGHVSVPSATTTTTSYGGRVICLWNQANNGSILVTHDQKTVTGGGALTKQSQFRMVPAGSHGQEYYLQSVKYSKMYLTIEEDTVTVSKDFNSKSTFKIDHDNDDSYEIFNFSDGIKKYVGVEEDGTVKTVRERSSPAAVFSVIQIGLGDDLKVSPSFYLWNKENGGNLQLVLQSDGKSFRVVGGGGETPQALICFIRIPGEGDVESVYALKSKLFPTMYLALSKDDGAVIVVSGEGRPPYPKWRVDWNSEGYYTFQSADALNRYIGVEKDGTVVVSDGENPTDKIKFQIHFSPRGVHADAARTDSQRTVRRNRCCVS